MDAAGFDEADFARPVRVHFPVENDIPPEGAFDTKFCENREPGGEDGKTLTLIPGAASAVKSDETERATVLALLPEKTGYRNLITRQQTLN